MMKNRQIRPFNSVGLVLAALVVFCIPVSAAVASTELNGLVMSFDPSTQIMVVAQADGNLRSVKWTPDTRTISDSGLPWQNSLVPGASVALQLDDRGVAKEVTIRTQLDEAAWYVSRITNCFRVRPDYIAKLHTDGASFEDICNALAIQKETGADTKQVLDDHSTLSWEQISDRYHVDSRVLDYWAERAFAGTSQMGMGGVDR